MAEWAKDLATYLIGQGLAENLGLDIYAGFWPDEVDNAVLIRDTGGFPPEAKLLDLKRTAQITVRDTDFDRGYARIWGIFNVIDQPTKRYIAVNSRQMVVRASQPPVPLGADEKGRLEFVFNLVARTSRD